MINGIMNALIRSSSRYVMANCHRHHPTSPLRLPLFHLNPRSNATATASSPPAPPLATHSHTPATSSNNYTHGQNHLRSTPLPAPDPDIDSSFIGMTGGQIFHEMMIRQNVKCIFGYPGGAILPVFDAIYNSEQFEFVLPRQENGAGFMAEGYAKVTGKPGVVVVTSGPGATNVITPMQDALSDGVPLVVFTGQVPTSAIGTDAFQEADVIGLSRSCTKWNVMVKDVAELPRRINEAFYIATSGRPGPVLVDLPKDITAGVLTKPIVGGIDPKVPGMAASRKYSSPVYASTSPTTNNDASFPSIHPDTYKSIQQAAKLINNATRPVLYVGAGILSDPMGPVLLKQLAEQGCIPVTTTLQALGAFDEESDLSLHMLGMHGSVYANLAMQKADVIVALGARFDDRVTGNLKKFAPEAHKAASESRGGIIHFEILPKNISKTVTPHLSVQGDVVTSLGYLLPLIQNNRDSQRQHWLDEIREWKRKYPFSYGSAPSASGKLKPQQVIDELNNLLADRKQDVIITTGVGQHQMWAAQFFRWRYPRTCITSGGLGTMGFGLPSAIGAKLGSKDSIVIDIDGDASFAMTAMEMMTARQFNIGVKVLILNNSFQGMVKQWQDLFYDQRYSSTQMVNPDFVKFAESMNCVGLRVSEESELRSTLKQFLETDQPVLLDAVVCKEEHVFPMVPAGMGLHEMVIGGGKRLEEPGF